MALRGSIGLGLVLAIFIACPTDALSASALSKDESEKSLKASPTSAAPRIQDQLVSPPSVGHEERPALSWWQNHEWWIAIFSGLLFLGTVALALYTAKLWRATVDLGVAAKITAERQAREMQESISVARAAADAAKKSADVAEKSLVATQRALVFPSKIHTMAGISQKAGGAVVDWTFFIVWENAGATPTRHMYMQTNWQSFATELGDDFDFPDLGAPPLRRVPIVLGPKSTTFSGECVIPIDILVGAAERRNHVYLWGWVEYNDIFDDTRRHRSEYSVQIIVAGDPKVPHFPGDPSSPNLPFFYRGGFKYSGMDEECFRTPMTRVT